MLLLHGFGQVRGQGHNVVQAGCHHRRDLRSQVALRVVFRPEERVVRQHHPGLGQFGMQVVVGALIDMAERRR